MARAERLSVYLDDEVVGTIYDATPLAFAYSPAWLARPEPLPVAAIPLLPGRQDAAFVQAFFENLLPEGELRDYIAQQKKASTLFSMLLEIAGDTAVRPIPSFGTEAMRANSGLFADNALTGEPTCASLACIPLKATSTCSTPPHPN
jgi:HipA-like protein